jgi:predicted S18 family serine protease
LKRLKLVTEFSKKITNILKELHQETIDLINMTENIVAEYSQCKNAAQEISEALF